MLHSREGEKRERRSYQSLAAALARLHGYDVSVVERVDQRDRDRSTAAGVSPSRREQEALEPRGHPKIAGNIRHNQEVQETGGGLPT